MAVQDNTMTSSRPYLIRAIYEWILENNMTPHVLVEVDHPDVIVPMDFVEDGKIVLNLSPSAVQNLELRNTVITFSARFSGKSMQIMIPVNKATALYARENGQGMVFAMESEQNSEQAIVENDSTRKVPGKPHLKVVK